MVIFFHKFIYFILFTFGCIGSLLLRTGYLLIAVASLVAEHGL